MRTELREQHERKREQRERERIPGQLAREPALVPGARQLRQDRHADGLGRDGDGDEDAVRGEQPVGLLAPAELAGDDDADDSRDSRHEQERGRRQTPARSEPAPGESVRLLTDAEAYGPCRTTLFGQAARSRVCAVSSANLRRPHRARHGRRRLHGLAPDRRAGRARRDRPRVRASDLERRAQQHLAPPEPAEGALRRPDGPHLGRLPRP